MTDLNESTLKLKSELVKNIESKVATSNLNLRKIESDTKAYCEEVKAVIKTITEEGKTLKRLIDKKVDSLVKIVQDGEQKALQSMSVLIKFNRGLLENCEQWETNVKHMEETADVLLLQNLKQIKTDVDKIECKQSFAAPFVSYRNRKSSGTDIDILFGELHLRDSKTFMETTDNQHNARPLAVQGKYIYECQLCETQQVSM
ncbi:uncharacterized protein LOC127714068 [Mytilus californianus]|uniref:uncharacterized protein LOC127714068 n=1 Tax=Mytilus californianus TaxID=6549 RepID=UPI0022485FEB|nr:uncharacterized protein LOC127714068 [Mytilus californianus]